MIKMKYNHQIICTRKYSCNYQKNFFVLSGYKPRACSRYTVINCRYFRSFTRKTFTRKMLYSLLLGPLLIKIKGKFENLLWDKFGELIPNPVKVFFADFYLHNTVDALKISVIRVAYWIDENPKLVGQWLSLLGLYGLILEPILGNYLVALFYSSLAFIFWIKLYGYYLCINQKIAKDYPLINLIIEFTFLVLLSLTVGWLLGNLENIFSLFLDRIYTFLSEYIYKMWAGGGPSSSGNSNQGTGQGTGGTPRGPTPKPNPWNRSSTAKNKRDIKHTVKLYDLYTKNREEWTEDDKKLMQDHAKEFGVDIDAYYVDKDIILEDTDRVERWKRAKEIRVKNFETNGKRGTTYTILLYDIYTKNTEEWTDDDRRLVREHAKEFGSHLDAYHMDKHSILKKGEKVENWKIEREIWDNDKDNRGKRPTVKLYDIYSKTWEECTVDEKRLVWEHAKEFGDNFDLYHMDKEHILKNTEKVENWKRDIEKWDKKDSAKRKATIELEQLLVKNPYELSAEDQEKLDKFKSEFSNDEEYEKGEQNILMTRDQRLSKAKPRGEKDKQKNKLSRLLGNLYCRPYDDLTEQEKAIVSDHRFTFTNQEEYEKAVNDILDRWGWLRDQSKKKANKEKADKELADIYNKEYTELNNTEINLIAEHSKQFANAFAYEKAKNELYNKVEGKAAIRKKAIDTNNEKEKQNRRLFSAYRKEAGLRSSEQNKLIEEHRNSFPNLDSYSKEQEIFLRKMDQKRIRTNENAEKKRKRED